MRKMKDKIEGSITNADSSTTSNGVKDYNDANRTIKIGFAGAGLNASNLTHIAGYTDDGTKIKDVSKDVLKSWIGLGNYLPLIGGTMSGQITKSTGGTWIGDRDRAAIKSSYAGDSSYGAVAAMATKNGCWTMGNLGGDESLIFNYSTDANYNAGNNSASQVYLPAQAGTIITSATIGSQSVNYSNSAGIATTAAKLGRDGNTGNPMVFNWTGIDGQPTWLWGGNDGTNMYVYNPSNFIVKYANRAGSVDWDNVAGKPRTFTPSAHTHNYAGSGSSGGSANSAVKLDSSAGSATQPVYFKDGKPVATTYALNKTVPADAKFTDTNTWRGIQNNLTSDSADQSLSAAQGKALKTLVDGKAPISHTHTKSQITDFPTSMPASDVSAWAKAATKPSYTKAEVGLGNVDNTADKDKNVKYATSAANATNTQYLNNDSQYMRFHWNGQSGQPTWIWGGNDASNMYVYNPSNFSVNYATTAGTALTAKNLPYSITYEGSYVGTARRDYLYNNDDPNYATETNPIRTTLSKEYDIVVFLEGWGRSTNETCPEKYAFLRLMNDTKFTQSYVVMSALTNEWTRGLSRPQSSGDVAYGPVIEYECSPKKSIKYRKNGTSIERYWTRETISSSGSLGEPGSANSLDRGAYMLLDRSGVTYHVFGIDIDHRFFVSSHADEEGSEVV